MSNNNNPMKRHTTSFGLKPSSCYYLYVKHLIDFNFSLNEQWKKLKDGHFSNSF